jgi:hypothetical protein
MPDDLNQSRAESPGLTKKASKLGGMEKSIGMNKTEKGAASKEKYLRKNADSYCMQDAKSLFTPEIDLFTLKNPRL